jgi:hypothetical protein
MECLEHLGRIIERLECLERAIWNNWSTWEESTYGVAGVPGEESMEWLGYLESGVWSAWGT